MASTTSSETILLQHVAKGDRAAFKTLFEFYQQPLFRYLVKTVRDEAMARDLTNEVMLAVWRGAGRFAGRSSVSTWIFGIAHNQAISALRKRREDQLDDSWAEQLADDGNTPFDDVQQGDMRALLARLLGQLSPEHREVIQLTYYQGFSIKEIAEVADCPEGTVKTRMHYARQKLKELLLDAGVEGAVL